MSIALNGTTQYCKVVASLLASSTPCTIAAWFSCGSITSADTIASLESGASDYRQLSAFGHLAGDPVVARCSPASVSASTTNGFSPIIWNHGCAVFSSNTSRTVYLNGNCKNVNTGNDGGLPVPTYFLVGADGNGGFNHFQGKIAHVAVWSVSLSEAEVISLAGGASPSTIQPGALVGYWPLLTDLQDLVGTNDLTSYGSPVFDAVDNPEVPSGYALQDFYNSGDKYDYDMYYTNPTTDKWGAQTFTATSSYTATRIRLILTRPNLTYSGTVYCSLYATSGGVPTGLPLVTVSCTWQSLPTVIQPDWVNFDFAGVDIVNGEVYAIVVHTTADTSHSINWRSDNSPPIYSGGQLFYSLNAGGAWAAVPTLDGLFEIYKTAFVPPTITDESTGATVEEGDAVNLYVVADGTEPLSYQWYKDGDVISGATSSTYNFTADKSDGGTYSCIVTNPYGSDTSSDMVLVVQYAPEIISQSGSTTAPIGAYVALFVVAEALPSLLTYQWYKGGNLIPGATMNTYGFFAAYQDAGTYTCVVSNAIGDTESAPIVVTAIRNPFQYNAFNRQIDQDRS